MTIASHELALYEINTGKRYDRRCRIARYPAHSAASCWLDIAKQAARDYERDFGTPGEGIFTCADLLECALELAAYYAEHMAERDEMREATEFEHLTRR